MDRYHENGCDWPSGVCVLLAERHDLSPSLHWKQFRLIKIRCGGKSFNIHTVSLQLLF